MFKKVQPLIVVQDMELSKKFYKDLLGLRVITDLGANVELTGGLSLQTLETWCVFIHKSNNDISFGGNCCELYFECDDFDGFIATLSDHQVEYVHLPQEHAWGQRVVRFYDPDKHVVEVGEDMTSVVARFVADGLDDEQLAKRMDVPMKFIQFYKKKLAKNKEE